MSFENICEQMNIKKFESEVLQSMKKSLIFLEKELSSIRTGRPHTGLVENIRIEVYGQFSPLKHLALISIPDSITINIQPFDTSIISSIQNTLSSEEFNFNPKSDGRMIKIIIPPLSQERREECKKMVHKKGEEFTIQLRAIRQEYINNIKKSEKEKLISQDFSLKLQKMIQILYEKTCETIKTIIEKKISSLIN